MYPFCALLVVIPFVVASRKAKRAGLLDAYTSPYQQLGFKGLCVHLFWEIDLVGAILVRLVSLWSGSARLGSPCLRPEAGEPVVKEGHGRPTRQFLAQAPLLDVLNSLASKWACALTHSTPRLQTIAVLALILLPLTLAGGVSSSWKAAHNIAMLVIGVVVCIPLFVVWEVKFARVPLFPFALMRTRTVLGCLGIAFLLNACWYMQGDYLYSVLQFAANESVLSATRITSSASIPCPARSRSVPGLVDPFLAQCTRSRRSSREPLRASSSASTCAASSL